MEKYNGGCGASDNDSGGGRGDRCGMVAIVMGMVMLDKEKETFEMRVVAFADGKIWKLEGGREGGGRLKSWW